MGVLELDGIDEVTGVNGAVRPDQDQARVLVRLHGAPLGFVIVPIRPLASLTPRVQMAAKASLADELDRHMALDAAADGIVVQDDWTTAVACPRRFAPGRGAAGGPGSASSSAAVTGPGDWPTA